MDLASSPLRTQLEQKARLLAYEPALLVCGRIGAVDLGVVEQVDTYFSMGRYRLKLRESSNGEHVLIGYSRSEGTSARRIQSRVAGVRAPRSVKDALTRQWGVKVVVVKRRHQFLWEDRVRIHLDQVEQLGEFIEIEAALDDAPDWYDEEAARFDLARLEHDFGLTPQDVVTEGYGNLVCQAAETPAGT